MEFHRLHLDICCRVRHLLPGTISFPEDRIVFGFKCPVDLKIVRLLCFLHNSFQRLPKSVVYGKRTSDITSENPLCCFFFLF